VYKLVGCHLLQKLDAFPTIPVVTFDTTTLEMSEA